MKMPYNSRVITTKVISIKAMRRKMNFNTGGIVVFLLHGLKI